MPNISTSLFTSFAAAASDVNIGHAFPRAAPHHTPAAAKPSIKTKMLLLGIIGALYSSLSLAPAFLSGASAADLPERTAPPAPITRVVASDWSGFYAGGFAGASWIESESNHNVAAYETVTQYGEPVTVPVRRAVFLSQEKGRLTGGVFGGYNWQLTDTVVAGVEADLGYGGAKGKLKNPITITNPNSSSYGYSVDGIAEEKFGGSVRARIGFLPTPRTLLYVTGGVAAAQVSYSIDETKPYISDTYGEDPAFNPGAYRKTKTAFGWIVGAGAEGKLTENILVRGQYTYSQLDGGKVENHKGTFGVAYKW